MIFQISKNKIIYSMSCTTRNIQRVSVYVFEKQIVTYASDKCDKDWGCIKKLLNIEKRFG